MITLTDVHKRYMTRRGLRWVLRGVSLSFPIDRSVALIGANGSGKSTLLRLIAAIDVPEQGQIRRDCRVSWPVGLTGGVQRALTGRQNARFICRIQGFDDNLDERVERIQAFSGIGDQFDDPVQTYSSGMRARLTCALSLAFDFDVYLVDEVISVGDSEFRVKIRQAFEELAQRSALIMTSHDEEILRAFCKSAVWLHKGQARWYDSLDKGLAAYNRKFAK